ncbi:MAG: hypothetical protein M3326_08460 [Actinomycetota bacterium]|nr:hypothetical protein [Actinomycetota bacterium]
MLGLGGTAAAAALGSSFVLQSPAGALSDGPYVPISQVQATGPDGPAATTIFEIQPADTTKAPFRLVLAGGEFFGVRDEVLYFGYNVGAYGGKVLDNEPTFTFNIEQDYFQSGTAHTLEAYWEFVNANGSRRYRPFFMQFDRDTGAMNACQFTSPSVLFRPLPTVEYAEEPPYMTVQPGTLQMTPRPGTSAQLDLRAPTGGHSVISLGDNGRYAASSIQTLGGSQLQFACGTARMFLFSGIGLSVNVYENRQAFLVASTNGGRVAAIRQGPDQAGSLLELQDTSQAVQSRFDKSGYFMTRKVVGPGDADIATGELAMWFDPKPGASKVMFKAKDANGTVVAGAVSLAAFVSTPTTSAGASSTTSTAQTSTTTGAPGASTATQGTTATPTTTPSAPATATTTAPPAAVRRATLGPAPPGTEPATPA